MRIRLSDARYEELKRIVVDMFVKHGVSCVPISAFELAFKMGITVIPYSAFPPRKRLLLLKKSTDGFSVKFATGEWRIYYNDNIQRNGRVNNTIMHEIGHIVLDHSEESDLAEAEVRFFAKYALVPPPLVRKLGTTDCVQVMTTFDVSIEAAQNALNYYNKWLAYGGEDYSDYEVTLLEQFNS